ncbi:MAG: UPF0149 family protein [Deltaproteobacteria bacterium]
MRKAEEAGAHRDASRSGCAPSRELAMRAQPIAHEFPIDSVDLEPLDEFLMSDRAPPNSMMLSDLDGFLAGIAVGPELVRPSEWLPLIWGGEAPEFASLDEANAIIGAIMCRYNEILTEVANGAFAPVFWADRDGALIAMDWAEGFLQAIMLRADAWKPLFTSKRDGKLLFLILSLCGDEEGGSLLGLPPQLEDRMVEQAPDLIPACVMEIAAYWRRKRPKQVSRPFGLGPRFEPKRAASKVGRNDPCPCGSGKKLKRCCGRDG